MPTTTEREITFHIPGRKSLRGIVKNSNARLGDVARTIKNKLRIPGAFECLDKQNRVLLEETRLAEIPDEVILASELTPAAFR